MKYVVVDLKDTHAWFYNTLMGAQGALNVLRDTYPGENRFVVAPVLNK